MGTYGDEVINVQEMILAGMSFRQIVSGQAVDQLRRRAYIAPGVYAMLAIGASEIVVPSSLDLWFARGARLRIDDGVTLRIRGRLIAEPTEIFSLPEVRDLTVVSGRSRVIFEGEDQEEIRPEWFGAVPEFRGDVNPPPGQRRKNARALQACVHAACRDRVRDGVPLPPLTVVLRDPIHFDETIEVLPPPGMRGVLWLRGDDTATRSGTGIAALQRHAAAGVGEANGPSAAALRIDPAVSVENQGVAVKVAIFDQPVGPQPSRDVGCAVLITESDATPPSRHVFFDDAGLVGGRAAIVKIADETARPPVLGAPARATRYGFRNCSFDLDDSSTSSAGAALDLDLTQDAMVTVTGGVIFQVAETPLTRIDTDAGVVVRGASVLVRGVSIHLTEGPRPSREGSGTSSARPDGQDFWVTAGRRSSGSHLTVMHLDSQSWWLLGATPLLDSGAVGAVSLVNVGAGNINWDAGPVASVRPSESTTDPTQARALTDPPTIAWAGGELPLLLAGCSFKRYVTMPPGAQKRVADVGTVFTLPLGASESAWWLSPDAIPQPRRRAVPLGDAREGGKPGALTVAVRRA